MVQTEPSLTLTLEALGPSGVVLATETKAALVHSLPIKKAESALRRLVLWGRISTRNGRDYLVAESTDSPHMYEGKYQCKSLYFYSQNGLKWTDLPPVAPHQAELASNLRTMLTGDTSTKFFWPPKPEGDEEPPADDGDGAKPKVEYKQISELERLRAMVDEIADATSLAPIGSLTITANNDVIPNALFSGLQYPDKLESYFHLRQGPQGQTAATDVRGSWTLHYDAFKDVTICRNLLFTGYAFYYARGSNTWGSFYSGDGLKNNDLIFML